MSKRIAVVALLGLVALTAWATTLVGTSSASGTWIEVIEGSAYSETFINRCADYTDAEFSDIDAWGPSSEYEIHATQVTLTGVYPHISKNDVRLRGYHDTGFVAYSKGWDDVNDNGVFEPGVGGDTIECTHLEIRNVRNYAKITPAADYVALPPSNIAPLPALSPTAVPLSAHVVGGGNLVPVAPTLTPFPDGYRPVAYTPPGNCWYYHTHSVDQLDFSQSFCATEDEAQLYDLVGAKTTTESIILHRHENNDTHCGTDGMQVCSWEQS